MKWMYVFVLIACSLLAGIFRSIELLKYSHSFSASPLLQGPRKAYYSFRYPHLSELLHAYEEIVRLSPSKRCQVIDQRNSEETNRDHRVLLPQKIFALTSSFFKDSDWLETAANVDAPSVEVPPPALMTDPFAVTHAIAKAPLPAAAVVVTEDDVDLCDLKPRLSKKVCWDDDRSTLSHLWMSKSKYYNVEDRAQCAEYRLFLHPTNSSFGWSFCFSNYSS